MLFFAGRMAIELGINTREDVEESLGCNTYLQGLEPHMEVDKMRWIRLASLYPEEINYVEFYYNGELFETAYDEPFMVKYSCNWRQDAVVDMDLKGGQLKYFKISLIKLLDLYVQILYNKYVQIKWLKRRHIHERQSE